MYVKTTDEGMKSLGKRKDTVNTVDKAWHEIWKKAPYILLSNKEQKKTEHKYGFIPTCAAIVWYLTSLS